MKKVSIINISSRSFNNNLSNKTVSWTFWGSSTFKNITINSENVDLVQQSMENSEDGKSARSKIKTKVR